MKLRAINIAEIVAASLFVTGLLLRLGHIPFVGIVTVLSSGTLSMLYFIPGTQTLKAPGMEQGNIMVYGALFAIAVIALMFSFLHWPFAKTYLIAGIGAFSTIAIWRVLAAYLLNRTEILAYSKGIAIRYAVLLVAMLMAFLSLNFNRPIKNESTSRSYPANIHQ